MQFYTKYKYTRQSYYFIQTFVCNKIVRIGKDFGSMGRSKPLYFVEIEDVIKSHGFNTQKEAKQYVNEYFSE